MSKDIMCIKVTKQTEPLVLKYGLYYSDVKPDKKKYANVSKIFIIGEAIDGEIPLIAVCDNPTIIETTQIHQAFKGCANGNSRWTYEWKLHNLNKVKLHDIRSYIISSGKRDIKLITNLQKIVYIESSNLNLPKKIKSIIMGNSNITSSSNKATNNTITAKVKVFQNLYKIGDIVPLRDKFGKVYCKGKVDNVKNLTKNNVLYDQELTIKNEKDGTTKLYSGLTLRKLEHKTTNE